MQVILATNLKCQACLNKLAPVLDAAQGIDSWQADLDHPQKLVTVDSTDLDSEAIVALVGAAGFEAHPAMTSYTSGSNVSPGEHALASGGLVNIQAPASKTVTKPNRLVVYKPLFIVVAYCFGGALLIAYARGVWTAAEVMGNFMGCFFLGFAFFKLLDVAKFAESFASYDPIASRLRAYGLAYPFVELLLGCMFILQVGTTIANIATICILGIGLIGVIDAVTRRRTIQCACLGTGFNLPMTSVTIVENSVMVAMAIAALVR